MASTILSFGEGIEYVLKAISIDSEQRQNYHEDAQIIENAFINAISRRDKTFRKAFNGLALTGSTLDKIKVDLPDEFDMLTKTKLPCIVEPVVFEKHRSFVALRLSGPNVPENLVEHHNGQKFLSRPKLHNWYRENIKDVMTELDNIQCGKHAYKLEYTAHGYGVAHTLEATCLGNRKRKIYFDFVPAFEFEASEWPKDLKKVCNNNRTWFAVPRKFTKPGATDDSRSFMVCAPYWERMVLADKQNLKDSLRLMKAMRDANGMNRLISYMIKTVFMNRANGTDETCNFWNESPGHILISVTKSMQKCLTRGFLPFYLVPDHNVFDTLGKSEQDEYKRMFDRFSGILGECRKKDCLSPKNMEILFGKSY